MKKAISLFAVFMVIAFLAISCSPKTQIYPLPIPVWDDDDTTDEPVITDPTDTDDPETVFYDNFTSDTTDYYFENVKFNTDGLQVHENGVATFYGGGQFMIFTPEKGINLLENDYELTFTFTPDASFSTAVADNKAYSFTAGMGKLVETYLSDTRSIYMTFADSDKAGELDIASTSMADAATEIPEEDIAATVAKGESVQVRIVYSLENYNTVNIRGYVDGDLIASCNGTAGVIFDSFQFSIWGPNGDAYYEAGPSYGTMDNFSVKAIRRSTPIDIPMSVEYPDSAYTTNKTLGTVEDITAELKALTDGSKIVLSGGEYNMSPDNETQYEGQTGWLFFIGADNVAIVAKDGETVTIESDDETPNGSWATQNLITIAGDNAVLGGLNIGTRANKNKAVEIVGNNAIIDSCTFLEDAVVYFNSMTDTPVENVTVKNCTFKNGAMLVLCNGVDGKITISDNTFESESGMVITGYRNSGWNERSVDLSEAEFAENTFEKGSYVRISYDETSPLNTSLSAFDISEIADNLGTAAETEGNYGETNFVYTAK